MVKWKTGLSCRSLAAVIGKQVNFALETSMNDTNYLISSQHLVISVTQTYFRAKLY
jgi:hypothetical protein